MEQNSLAARYVESGSRVMNGEAGHRGWISWISVLAYVGLCGLVYLLH